MAFAVDNELDLDELFENVIIPDNNMYISNEDKAVELISELIQNKPDSSGFVKEKIEHKINDLFSLFSDVTIENEMNLYERFMDLCSRLSVRHKIEKLQNRVVVSFGGKVSSGKSKFINSISGIGNTLPVDQKTTTAIPTYIIKSLIESVHANSVYGYSIDITPEALNAMAHEFDSVYGIGFPAFVDSIIVESDKYTLPEEIALLDTPGYTKYDQTSDSRRVISDRERAFEQLSVSDYLIWLIDIDSGSITEDDIEFISSLRIKTPILIVFTKADLKSENEINQIIKVAKNTIQKTAIDCFEITAYSANLSKEYGGDYITKFLDYAINGKTKRNDIIKEFSYVETEMRDAIKKAIKQNKDTAQSLFSYISKSDKIIEIKSLTTLLRSANHNETLLSGLLREFDDRIRDINSDIRQYIKGRDFHVEDI